MQIAPDIKAFFIVCVIVMFLAFLKWLCGNKAIKNGNEDKIYKSGITNIRG